LRDVRTSTLLSLPWKVLRRPEQKPPPGDWRVWYIRGGRGSGKTRAGSETLKEWIVANPGHEWAAVAPTFGDARDVCIEGPSGLLAAFDLPRSFKGWNRSYGELFLPDGSTVYCDGADDGALRIQGRNLAGLWADEVGLWRQWRLAWEESIAYAVRIDPARIVATGTPKRGHPLVKKLLHDDAIPTTRLRTQDNAANLSHRALEDLMRRYAGTTLGRQELEGEELAEVDGALWNRDMFRYDPAPQALVKGEYVDDYLRVVVAIDPAVTHGPDSDETGIIVAGVGRDQRGYVIDDLSGRYTPDQMRERAVAAYEEYGADAVIAEVNNGGDLIERILRDRNWRGAYRAVHASRGKRTRAEPVSRFYEQGRVSHLRSFPELEDQLCTFTAESLVSPDRLDALVWALTDLMVDETSYSGTLVGSN
jgi:predicted phage terminase large subunit-like protein